MTEKEKNGSESEILRYQELVRSWNVNPVLREFAVRQFIIPGRACFLSSKWVGPIWTFECVHLNSITKIQTKRPNI